MGRLAPGGPVEEDPDELGYSIGRECARADLASVGYVSPPMLLDIMPLDEQRAIRAAAWAEYIGDPGAAEDFRRAGGYH